MERQMSSLQSFVLATSAIQRNMNDLLAIASQSQTLDTNQLSKWIEILVLVGQFIAVLKRKQIALSNLSSEKTRLLVTQFEEEVDKLEELIGD